MAYNGWILSENQRGFILSCINPYFSNIVASHVTLEHDCNENVIPPDADIVMVGHSINDLVEAVVVEVNGRIIRDDGKLFHITLSLSTNGKPSDSNDLLDNGYANIARVSLGKCKGFFNHGNDNRYIVTELSSL